MFALALARTLAVFQLEQDRSLEEAERRAIVARTRERLGRELSDRVAHYLYAVGLLLAEGSKGAGADGPVLRALAELDLSLEELRGFMLDGEATAQADPATGGATDRVGRPAGRSPVLSA